jgi:hypothetical protein
MSQPFFEEVDTDGLMAKKSCVENTTSPPWLQQVCNTHKAGVMAGAGAIGGQVS